MRFSSIFATARSALLLLCAISSPALSQSRDSSAEQVVADAKAMMLNDPQSAVAVVAAERARLPVQARDRKTRLLSASLDWLQAEAYLRIGNNDKAALLVEQAVRGAFVDPAPSKLQGDILLTRGGIHTARTEVSLALSDYQRAYKIFRSVTDTRGQAMALISLGLIYSDANDSSSALRYLNQALDEHRDDPAMRAYVLNARAIVLGDMGRLAESEKDFDEAFKIARDVNVQLAASILAGAGLIDFKLNKLEAAAITIQNGMQLTSLGQATSWRPQIQANAARLALLQGRVAQARSTIDRVFKGVDLKTTNVSMHEAHQTAYDIYRATGEPAKALAHLAALKRLDDRTARLATTTNAALMAARFDFANQELKIEQLKSEELRRSVLDEQARARTQRYIFLGSTAATVIIIAVLGFALVVSRRSRNEVRAANDDLAVTNLALGKALAAKTEFLATTSHEIRTPLNGILGMTQIMLADRALDAAMRDRLSIVQTAGVTMRALVDDILDVAKMETGNLTLENAPFDLATLVLDASRMWTESAREKGVALNVDTSHGPGVIEGDAARLRQIVFNLLSNAVKFTTAGTIEVTVEECDADRFAITVQDSGIGIAEEKLDEIFESFRQADAGTTRQYGGTGLGLAICRNLARAMGGDVSVTSRAAEGSAFTVTLPLVRGVIPAGCGTAQGEQSALLVVEANPITRSLFRTLLTPVAGLVVFAGDAEEAAACIGSANIAAVLADEATLKKADDPIGALAKIAASARLRGILVHVLWAAGELTEKRGELMAAGADHLIAKPVAGKALVDMLRNSGSRQRGANVQVVSDAA